MVTLNFNTNNEYSLECITNVSFSVCGTEPYESSQFHCCGDLLYSIAQGYGPCCGDSGLESGHICCSNNQYNENDGYRCCDGQVYNINTQMCCGDMVHTGYDDCCDGTPYHTSLNFCCGGVQSKDVYDSCCEPLSIPFLSSSQYCCLGEVRARQNPPGTYPADGSCKL